MTKTKAAIFSLIIGAMAACGAAVLLAIVYAVAGLWLAGHNRSLLGWDGTRVTSFDWPNLIFTLGTLAIGLGVAWLCYHNWRAVDQHDKKS